MGRSWCLEEGMWATGLGAPGTLEPSKAGLEGEEITCEANGVRKEIRCVSRDPGSKACPGGLPKAKQRVGYAMVHTPCYR